MVIKRVIQACGTIYKITLQWLCSSDDISDEMHESWNQLCFIKTQILGLIDHENDGIRTNAIKFLEGVIILQSFTDSDSLKRENDFSLDNVPKTSDVIDKRRLEEEGKNIFEVLQKFHGASHISSVNLIACTGTLCSIAKLRPSFFPQVVDALKTLNSNLPPTLTNSQVSSVRKNLKMQFTNLLKHPASFEFRTLIIPTLVDLGATQNEINRSLPKMDKKEIQVRTKRALENEAVRTAAKKARIELDEKKKILLKLTASKEMEVDEDEISLQQQRAEAMNEKFIADALKSVELVAFLVTSSMSKLPDKCPESFLKNFQPSGEISIQQHIDRIAKSFAPQLTEVKLGPGAKELSAEKPMRAKASVKGSTSAGEKLEDEDFHKDETALKLRETLERMKGEQPKLKQRVKTLKLQEISKPLHQDVKQKFLLDAVKRILKCERQAIISGMGLKRKKILSVFASTFMPCVRTMIMDYIFEDLVKRIDLAFLWIFEEYSLLQGFSRYSYLKTEHKHDHAYNLLLTELVTKILGRGAEFRERESILKRIYLEAPLITDETLKILVEMAGEGLEECSLVLLKDLLIRRPPREEMLLNTLLKFTVHGHQATRDKAIENLMNVYTLHQILTEDIEKFAIKWIWFLEKQTPGNEMIKLLVVENRDDFEDISTWNENLVKLCLNLFLTILPYNEKLIHKLVDVYIAAPSDVKRIILRVIEAPIKKLGMESKEVLKVIDKCYKGSETLVTRIIYILTENGEWFNFSLN